MKSLILPNQWRLFPMLVVIFGLSNLVLAQQSVTSASLSGVVQDSAGAMVHGASLTATNLATNQKETTSTDDEGRYRFPYLQVGDYRLSVEAHGFTQLTKQLTVTLGQSLNLPIKLDIAGVTAEVDVATEAPLIETVRTQVTETIRPA